MLQIFSYIRNFVRLHGCISLSYKLDYHKITPNDNKTSAIIIHVLFDSHVAVTLSNMSLVATVDSRAVSW